MDAAKETEQQLIETARAALSDVDWVVGECASKWTRRHARGRTDADFAAIVGGDLNGDFVFKRRRTWETFADVRDNYANLKWSHFYAAIAWDDAAECLAWADENDATVAEMKAWRRMQHGEDLTVDADEEPGVEQFGAAEELPAAKPVSAPERKVEDPRGRGKDAPALVSPSTPEPSQSRAREVTPSETMATLADAQSAESKAYAPFKSTATTTPNEPPSSPPTSQKPTTADTPTGRNPLLSLIEQYLPACPDPAGFLVAVGDLVITHNRAAADRAVTELRRRLL